MKSHRFSLALLLVAILGLLGGLAWLIHLRFESGRAYAPRSSLRTDPLGSKALHDAYAEITGLEVRRNFAPLVQLQEIPRGAALLLLNTSGRQMHPLEEFDELRNFVAGGGRLVIAMNPDRTAYRYLEDESSSEEEEEDGDLAEEDDEDDRRFTRRSDSEDDFFWQGLALTYGEHEGGEAHLVTGSESLLPERIPWREGGVLVDFDPGIWTPLYQVGDEVVAAQRTLGKGSIVVLTDDYLFSNEALLKHRFPALLAWVPGGKDLIIFEETHLGVSEPSGVATLMRRYGLEGFALAFAGLLALVVWRGNSPMLPTFHGRARDQVIRSEHSTEAGLGDLIQRSLPAKTHPAAAFEAWKRTFIRTPADEKFYAAELQEIENLLHAQEQMPKRQRNPQATHSQIKSIINRKIRKRP